MLSQYVHEYVYVIYLQFMRRLLCLSRKSCQNIRTPHWIISEAAISDIAFLSLFYNRIYFCKKRENLAKMYQHQLKSKQTLTFLGVGQSLQ